MPSAPTPSLRQSADERRAAIIDAAVAEFALHGYAGASTEAIARRVGISQPYIFRLFGTKKEVFLAAAEQVYNQILALFEGAADQAEASGHDPLGRMGEAYAGLLTRKDELLMLLQTFSASGDPEIRDQVRTRYRHLMSVVQARSGADSAALFQFFANGMLLTVSAALDMPELYGQPPEEC